MSPLDRQAGLNAALRQLLLASYGLYPEDVERELASAALHIGGEELVLLLADYDQELLVGFGNADERAHAIDGPGPGEAYRWEKIVTQPAAGGRRQLWVPVKDSADRLGVFGVVDDGTVAEQDWEVIGSLLGELLTSKASYGDHITLRRRRGEFSLAAEMRWGLLPPLTFTSPDLDVAGYLQPSHGIAGDAFDYAVSKSSAMLGIFDAMGHGLEASRMANVAVASFRNCRRSGAKPREVLELLDQTIASEFPDARFVTAQVAEIDLGSGRLEIANAGHPRPLLLRDGSEPEELACTPARPAGLGGEPSVFETQLQPGDSLLFCTDGITEARSPDGEHFGDDRLARMVRALVEEGWPQAEVLRRSVHAVLRHQAGRMGDDATMLLATWHPSKG